MRGWTAASGNPALQRAQGEIEEEALPWIQQSLVAGQRIGAVRSDLPATLLIAVVLGMGEAMDLWLMGQPPGSADLPRHTSSLIDMMRGALAPPEAAGAGEPTAPSG